MPTEMTGYFRVEVRIGARVTQLWQAVKQGEVVGYFDAEAAAFALPEVYEMRVIDSCLTATIPGAATAP